VLIGCGIGFALDASYDTAPLWTIVMALLFMAFGFYHLLKGLWR
jgi:F0F1-type ATP synthase assembly protein I